MRSFWWVALVMAPGVAWADPIGPAYYWVSALAGAEGQADSVALIDANEMRDATGGKRAWVLTYYRPGAPTTEFESVQELIEVDCKDRRLRTLQATYKRGDDIRVHEGGMIWRFAPPGTTAGDYVQFVCTPASAREAEFPLLPADESPEHYAKRKFERRVR